MKTGGVLHADPPTLDAGRAADVARSLFGVESVSARPLVSERDQNFLVDAAGGSRWLLKVSNAAEDPGVVDMEVAAVEHVARMDPDLPVPRARLTLDGSPIGAVSDGTAEHLVRLLPFLPGRTAAPGELDADAVRGIGQVCACIGVALRGFFHPAAGRAIEWDQKHLPDLVRHAALVKDADRRRQLDRVLGRFMERALPALPALRAQVIHNDVTLDNLLLDDGGAVSGIIDFGDMTHTALLLDVPATLQSLVREREDIFAVAAEFLPGYSEVLPFERREAELLADVLAGRMAQTILISAWRTRQFPGNAYITGWAEPAWGMVPDVVTLGKPMGNGHPIAAVVTRGELADCMAQAETAFFSTFGGNPVACIAALIVLDVLDDEGLVENAAEVGGRLNAALAELAAGHPAIGDVRGLGLMLGVELVEPGESATPATDITRMARDGLRERGVLVGTTRREQNVLKIRPPLCITGDEAALIVSSLDEMLSALEADAT